MINHKKKSIFIHIPKTAGTSISEALGEPKDHAHLSIVDLIEAEAKKKFTFRPRRKRIVEKYFKFAFVRNPWDRMVSLYFEKFQTGWLDGISFEEYIENIFTNPAIISKDPNLANHARPCIDWISKDGKIMCDFIGRFECLQSDFSHICENLSISDHFLQNLRKRERAHYTTFYNENTQAIVEKYHRMDIDFFGYEFSGEDCSN